MQVNERIKIIRKKLELTQQEFADKLGIARNNIAGYETGKRSPSDAVVSLICTKFNVNEVWLRTGEGEMFVQHSTLSLDELAKFRNATTSDYQFVYNYLSLDPSVRQQILSLFSSKE